MKNSGLRLKHRAGLPPKEDKAAGYLEDSLEFLETNFSSVI